MHLHMYTYIHTHIHNIGAAVARQESAVHDPPQDERRLVLAICGGVELGTARRCLPRHGFQRPDAGSPHADAVNAQFPQVARASLGQLPL